MGPLLSGPPAPGWRERPTAPSVAVELAIGIPGCRKGGGAVADEVLRHIEALLEERRVIEPPEEFRRNALVSDEEIYRRAEGDPEGFWAEQADRLRWFRRWD